MVLVKEEILGERKWLLSLFFNIWMKVEIECIYDSLEYVLLFVDSGMRR